MSAEESLSKHTVILGVNERAAELVRLLRAKGQRVVVVSEHLKRFAKAVREVECIEGDFLVPDLLEQAGVRRASSVVILAETAELSPRDADARSVVATLTVEQINPDTRTVVEALSEDTTYHLRNAGVDEIIVSGELTADILAFSTSVPSYSKHLGVLLRFAHENRVVTAPVGERVKGKRLQHLVGLFAGERKVLLGVRVGGPEGRETLDPDYVVKDRDELVYIDVL